MANINTHPLSYITTNYYKLTPEKPCFLPSIKKCVKFGVTVPAFSGGIFKVIVLVSSKTLDKYRGEEVGQENTFYSYFS